LAMECALMINFFYFDKNLYRLLYLWSDRKPDEER
jgi:hypothetical protein